MRILGIDPGTAVTGYGILDKDGNTLSHVAHGEIKPQNGLSFSQALLFIDRHLSDVLLKMKPQTMAVENVFYGKNVRSLIKQAHVRGVAILAAARSGLNVYEYSPLEIKKAVVGYGRADKRQVQMMVKAILRLSKIPPADAADALATAICHANFI